MPYNIQNIFYNDSALGGRPDNYQGNMLVPLKGVVEALGGQVTFSGNAATVILDNATSHLTASQAQVQVTQGSNTTVINLSVAPVLSAAMQVQGSPKPVSDMSVPLEFLYKVYNYPVSYDVAQNFVYVG